MYTLIKWFYRLFRFSYLPEEEPLDRASAAPVNTTTTTTLSRQENNTVPSENSAPAANAYNGDYNHFPAYVDVRYFDWVVGHYDGHESENQLFEHRLLDNLDKVAQSELAGSDLIPRVPNVMVQLLKLIREKNVSDSELSRVIAQDVMLLAALLNEVNSAFYNRTDKVTDLNQAILIIGHTRLRMILAKISLTPVFKTQLGAFTQIPASKIWDESQKRALACYLLAKSQNLDPFMAFLAGLMQDVGLIAALRIFERNSEHNELPKSHHFCEAFQQRALTLSKRISHIWSLPEMVVSAIDEQSTDKGVALTTPLAKIVQRADFLSKTCLLVEAGELAVDMDSLRVVLSKAEMDCLVMLLEGKVSVESVL